MGGSGIRDWGVPLCSLTEGGLGGVADSRLGCAILSPPRQMGWSGVCITAQDGYDATTMPRDGLPFDDSGNLVPASAQASLSRDSQRRYQQSRIGLRRKPLSLGPLRTPPLQGGRMLGRPGQGSLSPLPWLETAALPAPRILSNATIAHVIKQARRISTSASRPRMTVQAARSPGSARPTGPIARPKSPNRKDRDPNNQ